MPLRIHIFIIYVRITANKWHEFIGKYVMCNFYELQEPTATFWLRTIILQVYRRLYIKELLKMYPTEQIKKKR